MATISDVARRAGVSIKTVSRVINGEPHVAPSTRTTVLSAMRELGYAANVSAQRLASGRSSAIAFVFHNPSWQYIQAALQGVLEAGRALGYETILHPVNVDEPADCRRVLALTQQRKADGLIFTPPCDIVEPVIAGLLDARTPFVCLTPRDRSGRFAAVSGDDFAGAAEMTRRLITLGHRRIGFVIGSPLQVASADRLAGYRSALADAQIGFDPALVVQGDFDFESGLAGGRVLLDRRPRPTAIFASNDDMAAGVLAVAHGMGVAVPGELSVAGFDETPLSAQVWPALTTVHQPVYDIAVQATQLLVDMLRGQAPAEVCRTLPVRVVTRQSTGRVYT